MYIVSNITDFSQYVKSNRDKYSVHMFHNQLYALGQKIAKNIIATGILDAD